MSTTFGATGFTTWPASWWSGAIRWALALGAGLALIALMFTAFVVVLPIMFVCGVALHFAMRRSLRRARERARRHPFPRHAAAPDHCADPVVIEGEYTVVEPELRRNRGSASSPH